MYFVCREVEHSGSTLHARMIFYNGEDPATGSAAGNTAAWAVKYGVLKSDEQAVIEQGIEMKRPSFIHVRATKSGDTGEKCPRGRLRGGSDARRSDDSDAHPTRTLDKLTFRRN